MNEKDARKFAAQHNITVGKIEYAASVAGTNKLDVPRSIKVGSHVVFHNADGGKACWKIRKPDGTTSKYAGIGYENMDWRDYLGLALHKAILLEIAAKL